MQCYCIIWMGGYLYASCDFLHKGRVEIKWTDSSLPVFQALSLFLIICFCTAGTSSTALFIIFIFWSFGTGFIQSTLGCGKNLQGLPLHKAHTYPRPRCFTHTHKWSRTVLAKKSEFLIKKAIFSYLYLFTVFLYCFSGRFHQAVYVRLLHQDF